VGKGNKENQGSFQNINFFEIFDAMDEEYLSEMALTDPKQLLRMCTFLTLDAQIKEEGYQKNSKDIITD